VSFVADFIEITN